MPSAASTVGSPHTSPSSIELLFDQFIQASKDSPEREPCPRRRRGLHLCRDTMASAAEKQLSTLISEATKERVERYADAHGVKKAHLIEEALLHHLKALQELPSDIIIPPRIELSAESFERVTALVTRPRKPSKALRDLMSGKSTKKTR